jgi:PKD repeat protein
MMSETMNERQGWGGNWVRWVRSLALAALLACGLAALTTGALPGLPGGLAARLSAYNRLRACGLGSSATMIANNAPALAYQQSQISNGVPLGIFALDFQANQQVTFFDDLSRVASAPDPNTVHWKWDFGDGSAPSYSYKSDHTYSAPGDYTVSVYIQDPVAGDWGDPFDHAVLKVTTSEIANPPVADARAVTSSVIAMGSKITFDANGSHPKVGSALTYAWNFGDFSANASGTHVTHEFDQQGYGMVTLTVTDARGARALAQVPVVIVQSLQPATFTATPQNAPTGSAISFDVSKTQPPQGEPVSVAWYFGDGSPAVTIQTPTISHIYTNPGKYTVTVAVFGQQDAVGSVAQQTVTITGAANAASANSGFSLPLIGGVVALLVIAIIGVVVWAARRQATLEREAQARMEAARARRARQVNRKAGGPGQRPPTRPGV